MPPFKRIFSLMKKQSLSMHLDELRKRILYSFLGFFIFFVMGLFQTSWLYHILIHPLSQLSEMPPSLLMTSITGGFSLSIQLAFLMGLVFGFPVVLYQIWRFVVPALRKKEIFVVRLFFILFPFLFSLGAAMAYFFVAPLAWSFMLSFSQLFQDVNIPLQVMPKIDDYLKLTLSFIVAFGLSFELPLVLILLMRLKVISVEALKKKRRYVIVGIFFVAAILTPPDVVSQILLAIPLMLLYEIAVFFGRKM